MPAAAAAQPLPARIYLESLQDGVTRGVYRQLAVGWIDGTLVGPDQQRSWYLGNGVKPDADSEFEIGAATEIFTGLLLAQAAIDGKVRLDSPLRDLLPRGFNFADPAIGTTSLRDLISQHSGFPSTPPNLFPSNLSDPYADFDAAALDVFLANDRAGKATLARQYSILNAGIVGTMLGRAYGQRFAVALVTHVLDPMGMAHTGFGDSQRLLSGYSHGRAAPHWHFGALAGAAGLRSTLPDLLRFMQANLTPGTSSLRAALLLSRQPLGDGEQSVGLGWDTHVLAAGQGWPLVWRASRTAGFSIFLGFRTDLQQALVLLGNTDADLSGLGIAWLEQRSPPALPRMADPSNESNLTDYVGLYQIEGGASFSIDICGQTLCAQFPGQFPIAMRLLETDAYGAPDAAFAVGFQRRDGIVLDAVLTRGETHVLGLRLSEHAPHIRRVPTPLAADALSAYAGDYSLNDNILLRVSAVDGHLSLRWTGGADRTLIAFAPDRFADPAGCCELHFVRAESGVVDRVTISLGGLDRVARRIVLRQPTQ